MNDEQRRTNILLEELMSQFRTFGEGLQIVNDKIDKMDQRIERVEHKLDAHIEQNRCDFEQNHQDHLRLMQLIRDTDIEVQELKRVK